MVDVTGFRSTASGPPGLVILLVQIIDTIFKNLNFPLWREQIPSWLCDESSNCWLSTETPGWPSQYLPELTSYHSFLAQNKLDQSLSSLYTFAFETPTTSLGVLTTKDSLVMLSLLVLIIRQIKAVLLPKFCDIGRNIGKSTHGSEWEQKNPERVMKFGEYVFRLMYHSTLSAFGVWYFWDASWWNKSQGGTMNLWIGYPNHSIEVGMIWYYLVQSAYNVDAIISLMEHSIVIKTQSPISLNKEGWKSPVVVSWSPTCRGDFQEMALHHVITNFLVIMSSYFRFTRIGSMVFLVHDISDVPVDMSKLANFMKWKVTTVLCFVTMLIGWIYCRLGILPFVIFKSVLTESPNLYSDSQLDVLVYQMYLPFFKILLGGLIALHFFWFFIIARIGIVLVTKGETHDLSEYKHGEDQISVDTITSLSS